MTNFAMKNILKSLLLLGLGMSLHWESFAQSERIKFLQNSVEFVYVENPNDKTTKKAPSLNPQEIYKGVYDNDSIRNFWIIPELTEAQNLAKALFQKPEDDGDTLLQQVTEAVLRLNNGKLLVALLNDSKTPLNAGAVAQWQPTLDSEGYILPYADPSPSDTFNIMLFGTRNMYDYGDTWSRAKFKHWLTHTVIPVDHEYHDLQLSYAGENSPVEAIPNMDLTYWESIATMTNYLADPDVLQRAFAWYTSNGQLLVKIEPDPGVKVGFWLYNRLKVDSEGQDVDDMVGYKQYRIRDLSPQAVIHQEAVMGMLLAQYAKHFGIQETFRLIYQENEAAQQANGFYSAALMDKLIEAAQDTSGLIHLLPIAYADYLTGYRIQSVDEFSGTFDSLLDREWVDQYWQKKKDLIRSRVSTQASEMSLADFNTIADLLESEPESNSASSENLAESTEPSKRLKFIHEKLGFIYVSEPHEGVEGSTWWLDNSSVYSGNYSKKEAGNLWVNPNMKSAQQLLKKLLRDPKDGGNARLQRVVYRILRMGSKEDRYGISLIDDSDNSLSKFVEDVFEPCLDTQGKVWPCTMREDATSHNIYHLSMGAYNMSYYGYDWTEAQFVHALMHAQEHPAMGAHLWYPYTKEGQYATKGDHYMLEAVTIVEEAYWESIANMAAYLVDAGLLRRTFVWFKNNNTLLVQAQRAESDLSTASSSWYGYRSLGEEYEEVEGKPNFRKYSIRSIKPELTLKNETIMGMLLAQYAKYNGFSKTFSIIHGETSRAAKYEGFYSSILIDELCKRNFKLQQKKGKNIYLTYMLPLAYADYFTGFKTETQEAFAELFDNKVSPHAIAEYWIMAREQVRSRVSNSPEQMSLKDFGTLAKLLERQSWQDLWPEGSE